MKDIAGLQSLLYREEFMMSERAKVTSFIVKKLKTYSFSESNHIYLQQRWLISTALNCWDIYTVGPGYESGNSLRKNRQGVLCNIVENLLLTVRAHSYLLYRYCRLVIHNHLTL